ncbi:MAG: hypothetical protein ACR2QH_18660 [Geminicoccaceae bacterium]
MRSPELQVNLNLVAKICTLRCNRIALDGLTQQGDHDDCLSNGPLPMIEEGILAIWNDCKPGHRDAYEAWYQGEHLIERLAVPGFLRGRRYQAIDAMAPAFFTYYKTRTPDVLTTSAYRSRIDNPTPETARIMSGIFCNMSRTVCRVTVRVGQMRGSVALTIKLAETPPMSDVLAGKDDDPGIARAELWEAAQETDLSVSCEETLRGEDDKITACLSIETLREEVARKVMDNLSRRLAGAINEAGIYRLLCELTPETTS